MSQCSREEISLFGGLLVYYWWCWSSRANQTKLIPYANILILIALRIQWSVNSVMAFFFLFLMCFPKCKVKFIALVWKQIVANSTIVLRIIFILAINFINSIPIHHYLSVFKCIDAICYCVVGDLVLGSRTIHMINTVSQFLSFFKTEAHREMRTTTNYYLLNLSVADLLMSALNCSFNFIYMLFSDWPFGSVYCTVNNFMGNVTVATSVFTLVAISFNRYVIQWIFQWK